MTWQLQPSSCEQRPETPEHIRSWQKKWENKTTAWHKQEAHPKLLKYLDKLMPGGPDSAGSMGARVLFPLCGKTVDMAFLSCAGYRVVGIDCAGQAFDEFAAEHSAIEATMPVTLPKEIDPKSFKASAMMPKQQEKDMARMPQPIILVEGDFLALGSKEAEALVPFDAVFDRGSFVAIDPASRPQYAQVLGSLVAPGGKVLLAAVERDATSDGRFGPPFELTEAQVRKLCGDKFEVVLLERNDVFALPAEKRWQEMGVTRFHECTYLLTRRQEK